ncbi:MAG: TIGR01212 family radical SAM protein [Candidatus Rifleibacteriota bacterium]
MSIVNFARHPQGRIQKIPVDAGFSCPNRDGTLSENGCFFCSPESYQPFYCSREKSVTRQLEEGIAFYSKRYRCAGFLAYFQSHTGTYSSVDRLEKLLQETASHEAISGIVISTRPDCMADDLLLRLKELGRKKTIMLEVGVESLHDASLKAVNRCHTADVAIDAVSRAVKMDFKVCVHLIFGLPFETVETLTETARKLTLIKPASLKIHHLQIVKGAQFGHELASGRLDFKLLDPDQYIKLLSCFLINLGKEIQIERLISRVPEKYLLGPFWNKLGESELRKALVDYMAKSGFYQGM